MNRSRQPKLIDFSAKYLLSDTPQLPTRRHAQVQASASARPFAAAADVQSYLANLQAKVKAVEKRDESESSPTLSDEPTVVGQRKKSNASIRKGNIIIPEGNKFIAGPDVRNKQIDESSPGIILKSKEETHEKSINKTDSDSESITDSISTIFNVRSLSEIASELVESGEQNFSSSTRSSSPNIATASQRRDSSHNSSGSNENIRSFGSLDYPTEIEIPKRVGSEPYVISGSETATNNGTSNRHSPDNYHTLSAAETEGGIGEISSISEKHQYDSDFEIPDQSDDETVATVTESKSARSDEAMVSGQRSNLECDHEVVSKSLRPETKYKSKSRDVPVQKYTTAKSVQTDACPPAFLSVAEYFHVDPTVSRSDVPKSAAFEANLALANYREAIHPASYQNRLIASVLEAHLRCIRIFAECQKDIYDHWNDILSEHNALTMKSASRRHRKYK